MKWTRSDLLKTPSGNLSFEEDVKIDPAVFAENSRINGVEEVHVSGTGYMDEESEKFYVSMHISGVMLLPDAITGEELEYPFETDTNETYSFDETDEEDVRVVTEDVIELLPAVIDQIMMDVPLQVTDAASEDYPKGDGWRVISEEEYQREQKSSIDPRLAKLKDFKEE